MLPQREAGMDPYYLAAVIQQPPTVCVAHTTLDPDDPGPLPTLGIAAWRVPQSPAARFSCGIIDVWQTTYPRRA